MNRKTWGEKIALSKEYKSMEAFVEKILVEQWEHCIYSGLINSVYSRYSDYFVRRKKVSKALGEDIKSKKELKEKIKELQENDRFLVDDKFLNMVAFTALITYLVTKNIKSVGSYYSFKSAFRNYLTGIANKGGQDVVDAIVGSSAIKFRLSQQAYKNKIIKRVSQLTGALDKTSKAKLVSSIVKGVIAGETKSQMIGRLQKEAKKIAATRSKTILATESVSAGEFMRYETARRNGVQTKTWFTALDERVCVLCSPLHGQTVSIDEDFQSSGYSIPYSPAHISCRCTVDYDIDGSLVDNYLEKSVHNKISEMVLKAKLDGYVPYKKNKVFTVTNREAIWAGGESLVGKDKNIGNYYSEIMSTPIVKRPEKLLEFQELLTEGGFVQLKLSIFNR